MRQSKPWFRASPSAWYVEHRGKLVRLGGHSDSAPPPILAFYKLLAADPASLPTADALMPSRSATCSTTSPSGTTSGPPYL